MDALGSAAATDTARSAVPDTAVATEGVSAGSVEIENGSRRIVAEVASAPAPRGMATTWKVAEDPTARPASGKLAVGLTNSGRTSSPPNGSTTVIDWGVSVAPGEGDSEPTSASNGKVTRRRSWLASASDTLRTANV